MWLQVPDPGRKWSQHHSGFLFQKVTFISDTFSGECLDLEGKIFSLYFSSLSSYFFIYYIYIYTFYYSIYISSHLPQCSLKCPLLPPSCLLFIFYNLETNYCCLLECWLSSLTWSSTGNHSNIEFMSAMVIPSPEDTMAQHHPLLWHICSFCPFLEAVPWALVAAAVTQMSHQWMTVHQLLFLSMLTSS